MKRYADAKAAWGKALEYLSRDRMAKNNLKYMIYENPDVPEEIRKCPSIYFVDPEDVSH